MSLDAKLDRVVARAEELSAILAGTDARPARDFARLSKEYADPMPVVEGIGELRKAREELESLRALMDDPESEADMRALARASGSGGAPGTGTGEGSDRETAERVLERLFGLDAGNAPTEEGDDGKETAE